MTSDRAARRALVVLCLVVFITFLDTTIVSVALADVQSRLRAGVTSLQWVVNGYALAFASLMLAFGALSDQIGRRKVLSFGLALFSAGSLFAALAPSSGALIAARVVMGVGAAASEPGTLSIIRHVFTESTARARALGAWTAVCGLGLAAGPVIGGILVGFGTWRAVFYFSLAVGLVALIATQRVIPESSDPLPGRFDYPGFVTGSASIALLAFAVIVGESAGYTNAGVIVMFVLGAAFGIAFVYVERRAEHALLDLRYLRNPMFSGVLSVAFAVFFGIFAIFFFTALYLQLVTGYSAYRTALEYLPMTVCLVASSLSAGRIVARVGPRLPMSIGALLAGTGVLWADAVIARGGVPSGWLIVALALSGSGFGLCIVPVTSVALAVVPPERSGMAASATNTSRELGAVFGVAVLGALVNSSLTANLMAKLHELGIPSAFQAIVIGAIETGSVPSGGAQQGDIKAFGPIVAKVISAAYGAFRSGLEVSLLISGIAMLIGATIAFTTLHERVEAPPLVVHDAARV